MKLVNIMKSHSTDKISHHKKLICRLMWDYVSET